jgi:hypothetical protein
MSQHSHANVPIGSHFRQLILPVISARVCVRGFEPRSRGIFPARTDAARDKNRFLALFTRFQRKVTISAVNG